LVPVQALTRQTIKEVDLGTFLLLMIRQGV
jgi:hypothetical protein